MVRVSDREETDGGEDLGEALLKERVGLLETVECANNFNPLAGEGMREVVREAHDNLLTARG